jgi:hypothetical protein
MPKSPHQKYLALIRSQRFLFRSANIPINPFTKGGSRFGNHRQMVSEQAVILK